MKDSHTNAIFAPLLLGVIMLGSGSAHALLLNPTNAICSGDGHSQTLAISQFEACAGAGTFDELYKSEISDEEGDFASIYDTTYYPDNDDPWGATLEKVSSPAIDPSDFTALWAMAKDGNAQPAWYGWNLLALGWDGVVDLVFEDLWGPDDGPEGSVNGAISNISIRGIPGNDDPVGGPSSVPAPAPLVLIGLGGLLLGLMRRNAAASGKKRG